MKIHRHQPAVTPGATRDHLWTVCVTPDVCAARPWRQAAHGGVTRTDTCSCGATRATEINNRIRNNGPWKDPEA